MDVQVTLLVMVTIIVVITVAVVLIVVPGPVNESLSLLKPVKR